MRRSSLMNLACPSLKTFISNEAGFLFYLAACLVENFPDTQRKAYKTSGLTRSYPRLQKYSVPQIKSVPRLSFLQIFGKTSLPSSGFLGYNWKSSWQCVPLKNLEWVKTREDSLRKGPWFYYTRWHTSPAPVKPCKHHIKRWNIRSWQTWLLGHLFYLQHPLKNSYKRWIQGL